MTSEAIRFVNAVVGFCKRTGDWPSPLADLGYVACGVERGLRVLVDGNEQTVMADLICGSDHVHHALCLEMKSATMHEKQARGYQALTARSVLQLGGLPPTIDPFRLTHDVAYLTHRVNVAALGDQFERAGITLPILAGDEDRFDLARGTIGQPEVHDVFAGGIVVDAAAWPRHYVPFKSDSPDGDIVPFVVRALSRFIILGQSFTIEQLAEQSVPHWPMCGDGERRAIREKLSRLANLAMREELKDYYERPGKPQAWVVNGLPMAQPNQLGRLNRLANSFIERVQKKLPFQPDQLPLGPGFFGGIDDEEEADEF